MVNRAVKYFMVLLMIIDFLPDALTVYVRVCYWSRAAIITCRDQLLIYHLTMKVVVVNIKFI